MKQILNISCLCILLVGAGALLAGCGIKPNDLSAPNQDYRPEFPQTYPQP